MYLEQPDGIPDKVFPLEELSWKINKNAGIVSRYLGANNLPQPSLESRGPSTVVPNGSPHYIKHAQQNLISAALELFQLATGPSEFLPNLATGFQYISCLSWLCQYDIFHLVPLEDTISYADLAAKAGVPEQRLKSIIRMAMTNTLFREQPDGRTVGHSSTSALLARNEDTYAYATYMCAKSAPMAMSMAAAHERWGADTTRTYETAYNVAFNTDLPFFDHLSRDEAKTSEFAKYMRNVRSSEGVDLKHLVAGFPWATINEGGKVVDIGGSTGSAAIALAQANPHLHFIVQDLPGNASAGEKALPPNLRPRIALQAHDFTHPQPVHDADVYLLRMILHDWPDADAATILSHTAAAMKPGARLVVMDTVLPVPGAAPVAVERIVRVRDLTMMQAFNSKERDLEDWRALLARTDRKLRLVDVVQPAGSAMSVLEVVLDGEESNV